MPEPLRIDFKPSWKQHLAWQILQDKKTKQLLYGGGGGGGKTYLGSAWKIWRRLQYPGSRGLISREKWVDINDSVLVTFRNVLKLFGLFEGKHCKYHGTEHYFEFANGSIEMFKQLPFIPSDPHYEYLGSKEYTDVWLEEASELTEKALEVVTTRVRWMLSDFDLIPKILLTCNPSINWLYKEFYAPHRDGKLDVKRAFIRALVTDNPDKDFVRIYLESLNDIKDPVIRARIRDGDWEFSNDALVLYLYEKLINSFHNKFVPEGDKYLTVDTSRFGKDKTIIYLWSGFRVKERYEIIHKRDNPVNPTNQTVSKIKELEKTKGVPRGNIIVDEAGAGGAGVVDGLPGCFNFVGSSKPIKDDHKEPKEGEPLKPNYDHFKAQCAYLLADVLNDDGIAIEIEDVEVVNKIIEEAMAHKKKSVHSDKKLGITPKETISELLKRSPDDWDQFIMRMAKEVKKKVSLSSRKIGRRRNNHDIE